MASLDIFNGDAFTLQGMTKSLNDIPFTPTRIGEMKLFSEEGITTTSVSIERIGTTLSMVQSAPRGSPAKSNSNDKRTLRNLNAVHLPQRDAILADEVQNVRAFGSETELQSIESVVARKLAKARRNLDVTIEYQRLGAVKGLVVDADGTTPLIDMYSEFGLTQQVVPMLLSVDATRVKSKTVGALRLLDTALGGLSYRGATALCSATFFDAFVEHPAVAKAYDRYLDGQFLRDDNRTGFFFAGVFWEEYRGKVNNISFIEDDAAYLVPEGVPDMFTTYYAPADYTETVNTNGLPYYARQMLMDFNKGVELEFQSNPLCLNTRPNAVIKLTK